jgi:hypothetical protein
MQVMYPEVEDDRDDNQPSKSHDCHGIVLLSAAVLESIELRRLVAFSGYSQEFISTLH